MLRGAVQAVERGRFASTDRYGFAAQSDSAAQLDGSEAAPLRPRP
jgi:hypothetical protein